MLLAGCVTAPERLSPEEVASLTLADRFERVAFFHDGQTHDGEEHTLWRWETDPVFGSVSVEMFEPLLPYEATLAAVITDINDATGLNIDAGHPANLLLLTGNRSALQRVSATLGNPAPANYLDCGLDLFGSMPVLTGAAIYVRAGTDAETVRNCIAQEITQAMGLTADLDGAGDTVMDSYSTLDRLSETDKRLLSILYDPRLGPGMTRQEAMPIVREIIAERGW
ncbi:MAG TPA: DUF2927 domain-containing protein [Alphaproteobacteria bacterium]|nr:DUF2927 domain-containing protein [Alphaproteobacteria bacterium]